MKKTIAIMITLMTIAMCASGCSSTDNAANGSNSPTYAPTGEINAADAPGGDNGATVAPDSDAGAGNVPGGDSNDQDNASGAPQGGYSVQSYFGKVKNLLGNQLTVRLAKQPDAPADEDAPLQSDDEGADTAQGTVVAAATMTLAVAADTVSDVEAEERMELEWLDEEKVFTLPAGLRITDRASGQTVTMDSIGKSDVLMLTVDESSGSVLEVVIWERH